MIQSASEIVRAVTARERSSVEVLDGPGARWRVPFSHHPPFCAGPEHTNTAGMVERLVSLFERARIALVLSGHEHNFQHAVVNDIRTRIASIG